MSFLGGAKSNAATAPDYTQVQIQTSSEGVAITVVYGVNRVAPNVIFLDNFKKHKSGGKGGKGGGGKGSGGGTSYTASLMLGICEGPIHGIDAVFKNTDVISLASLGMALYPGDATQTPFNVIAHAGTVHLAYRGVAYLAANNYNLGSTATVPQNSLVVRGFFSEHGDVLPDVVIYDICTNARYGLGMPPTQIGDRTLYAAYCTALGIVMSPVLANQEQAISIFQRWAELTNTWIFWSENQMKFVPLGDRAIGGFTPLTTVRYDLTVDDFCPSSGEPPITVAIADPSDAYNWVRVNIAARDNQYGSATMEYKDQTSIERFGLLQSQDVQANEICQRSIGATIAGLVGARALYIRRVYAFNLSFNFCLLEPGDIVTVNDADIGLSQHRVRIRTVEEDAAGVLKFTAEECPDGSGTAAAVGVQDSAAVTLPSIDDDPGPVNPPLLIEPPASVTANVAQIWIGVSGASLLWGGADVWVSVDDVTYIQAGSLDQVTPQGVLIANLPTHADPDSSNTLSIDFSESQQAIGAAVTHADADALRTVAVVGNEVIGYGAVIPNGFNSFTYDLSYLRRGAYNSTISAAAIGDQASLLLPGAVLKLALPAAYVGHTLYFKFPSFNILGGGQEDISSVTRYTYVPTGVVYRIDPPSSPALAITTPAGATSIALTLSWVASDGPALGGYEAQLSSDGGSTWTAADGSLGAGALAFTLSGATPLATYQGRVRAIASSGLAVSAWVTSATLNAGPAPVVSGGLALPLVNGDLPIGIMVDPLGVPVYVVQ